MENDTRTETQKIIDAMIAELTAEAPKARTPNLELTIGGLQTARENLARHLAITDPATK